VLTIGKLLVIAAVSAIGAIACHVLRLVHAAGHCISSYRTPLTMRIADGSHFAAAYTQSFESSARVAGL
jgi:hypothetical protein